MKESLVTYTPDDGFAWIRINREAKRNAMDQAARDALREALLRARGETAVVILTGTGRAFCAGIDLKEVRAQSEHGSDQALVDWRALNLEIREHPAVFIAAVNGIALGGGTTLAGVCDLALAADEAEFGLPEVGFGMYPNPAGPAAQLNLTRKRAAWLVLTAERIDGPTAAAWGLVNESVAGAELETRAAAIARRLGTFDPVTLREAKRALDTIPLAVEDWPAAFAFGSEVNKRIQAESDHANSALDGFRAGRRNPGQG